MSDLTNKEQLFVEEYLQRMNATQAAIAAGYSKKSARSIGSELLTKPDIQTRVRERLDEAAADANEVLRVLTTHLRGRSDDFYRIDPDGKPVADFKKAKRLGSLALVQSISFEKETRTTGSGDEAITVVTENVKFELYSAQTAAQMLGKYHKLFDRALEGDWQREMEAAGLNPSDEFEKLVKNYASTLRAGGAGDAGGSLDGGAASA